MRQGTLPLLPIMIVMMVFHLFFLMIVQQELLFPLLMMNGLVPDGLVSEKES